MKRSVRIAGYIYFFALVEIIAYEVFSDRAPDQTVELISTLIGTGVGAGLAAAIGVELFYWQRDKNEERRKRQLRNALIAELQATKDRLNTTSRTSVPAPPGSDAPDAEVVLTHLEPIACEEAIRSALFTHGDHVNLTRLAQAMRQCTKETDLLRELLVESPFADLEGNNHRVARNVQGSERYVVMWCDAVLKGFDAQGIEIPPEVKFYSDPNNEGSLEDVIQQSQPMQSNE